MSAAIMETNAPVKTRMVVVSGVPEVLANSRMIDKLTIHFQSSRSHGGDVEDIRYPTNLKGVAFVTFEEAKDAERVVRKDLQIMKDKEFPEDYHLTVFPFTPDVFFYVTSATVDLSVFSDDQESLLQSLRSAHRSVRFQVLPQETRATVEGPFTAIQALREDLISRTSMHRNPALAQTAETPLNLSVISHHECVGPPSSNDAETYQEPMGSVSLSKTLQSTHDATEDSNAKNLNSPIRQKPHPEILVTNSFCYTNSNAEEEQSAQSSLDMPGPSHAIPLDVIRSSQSNTEYRAEQAKAGIEEVLEMNAWIRSFLSRTDQLTAEEKSAKQTGVESISGNQTRLDSISADQTSGDSIQGYYYTSVDDMNRSDQTSPKDTSASSETDSRDMEGLYTVSTEDLEDECIWVDSNTFRYIERFDTKEFNRCLRERDVSLRYDEGADLTRISLTGRQGTTPSEVQQASACLKSLFDYWQSTLRVHSIDWESNASPEKQRLTQICDHVNTLFPDVLYTVEDSRVRVVGPSTSSHLFCKWVKEDIAKPKDTYL
ncbi:uncharacterized protein [Centroberyx affinis]|uniref:uncharacterized protein isoform X1 n=1 Tax=Centroberyx affinis TaxID=166261 RepID=UPI003A5BF37E